METTMMKRFAAMIMLIGIFSHLPAQNYKFQSLFIYNIVKRINWPPGSDDFVIGIVGSKELMAELQSLSQKKKLGNQTIKVVPLNLSNNSLDDIQVVYLGRGSSSKIKDLIAKVESDPILIIGDKPGLKGAGINFIDNSKTIEFEIYPNNIEEQKLAIASSLLSLGIVKQ